jgi:hypothetical protein
MSNGRKESKSLDLFYIFVCPLSCCLLAILASIMPFLLSFCLLFYFSSALVASHSPFYVFCTLVTQFAVLIFWVLPVSLLILSFCSRLLNVLCTFRYHLFLRLPDPWPKLRFEIHWNIFWEYRLFHQSLKVPTSSKICDLWILSKAGFQDLS